MRCKSWLRKLLDEETGATATEYAIMIVLILLVAFATIVVLGYQVDQAFNKFTTEFAAAQST